MRFSGFLAAVAVCAAAIVLAARLGGVGLNIVAALAVVWVAIGIDDLGIGGVLPGAQMTAEIARARAVR